MSLDPALFSLVEIAAGRLSCRGVKVSRAEVDLEQLRAGVGDIAHQILTAVESATLQSIRHESRKLEWLGGRLGAKLLVAQQNGARSLRDIEIRPDMWGAPIPVVRSSESVDERAPSISISHSRGRVIAAMLPGWLGARLGIDIEQVKPRSPSFIKKVFNARERSRLESEGFDSRGVILRWSLKEAAFKALGLGLFHLMPADVEILSLSTDGEALLKLHGKAKDRFRALEGASILGHGLIDGEYASVECVVTTRCSSPIRCL